jgi:hypothetical protein
MMLRPRRSPITRPRWRSTRSSLDTAERSIATASASSPTEHGERRRRPSMRTRLGVASACIVSATSAVVASSNRSPVPARIRRSPPSGLKRSRSLAQVQQLDRTLAHATQAYDLASLRLSHVRDDIRENTQRLSIASSNLRRAQRNLSTRLVEIYVAGQGDSTLEVFLGATSADDLLSRIDSADRVAREDASVLRQVTAFRKEVRERQARLRETKRKVSQLSRATSSSSTGLGTKGCTSATTNSFTRPTQATS